MVLPTGHHDKKGGTRLARQRRLREQLTQNYFLPVYIGGLLLLALFWPDQQPVLSGLLSIIRSPDILINDYMETGGIRAAFLNASLVGLAGYGLLKLTRTPVSGPTIAAVFTMTGFALFGKNVLNIGPIIFGVYLYSLLRREHFRHHVIIALFGTSLSPIVSQFAFGYGFGLPVGTIVGIITGFLIPGLVTHLIHNHQGFLLYNVGFTAGFIGTLVASQMRGFGRVTNPVLIWSTEYSVPLAAIFSIYFASFILLGLLLEPGCWKKMRQIIHYPGSLVTDFTALVGLPVTLVNMGLVGLIGMAYVLLVGGVVNGPTLGALFTMAGFAAFGKHPRNIIPLMLGVYLGTLLKVFHATEPGPLLAALFVTGIAPISGAYGPWIGLLAGYLHLSMVMHIGWLHGGLNLYNNGFSGGIVAIIIVATVRGLRSRRNE